MVALKHAGPAASRFYIYLQGEAARAIFRKHGYSVPK
jgi:hypothetical protein